MSGSGRTHRIPIAAAAAAVLLLAAAPSFAAVLEGGNDVYRVFVNDAGESFPGCYTATTGPAHPAGEGLNLLYGDGNPGTSSFTVRSYATGTDYVVGGGDYEPGAFTYVDLSPYAAVEALGSRGVRSTFTLPGPPATPDALVITSDVKVEGDGYTRSAITVSTSVRNLGAVPGRFGVRYLWDFQIGLDDGPTFQAVGPDGAVLVEEEEFPFPRMHSYRMTDNDGNPSPPTFFVLGSAAGDTGYGNTAPDLLRFVSWPGSAGTAFDYGMVPGQDVASVPPGQAGVVNDSAVLYYFGQDEANAFPVDPGAAATVTANLYLAPPPPPSGGLAARVDVRPGSERNPLNLSERGALPVAILGSPSFPVDRIDAATVTLEGVAATRVARSDADSDGEADLVLHFDAPSVAAAVAHRIGRTPSDGEKVLLFLRGKLAVDLGAEPFAGSDTVTFLAKKGAGR
jgi:hypothetical protein